MAVASTTRATSQHVADSAVQPFLTTDFDPADYLNATLNIRNAPLPELSSQLQTLLTQLNAHTTRLSNTLTQLTDEIIRSGGRLAYEVEVLRGDTVGLTDALEHGLKRDIELLAPKAVAADTAAENNEANNDTVATQKVGTDEPEYLEKLRTLTAVRSRLDAVIQVFGDAMAWPLAPLELFGVASSLISVSAPESDTDARDREEKGKEYMGKLRSEINDLVGSGNDMASLEAAAVRVEELRQLAEVWKGTAEEKARMKLVENLQKPIEERQKVLERSGQVRKPAASPSRGVDYRYGNLDSSRAASEGGYGFLSNLRKLKDEMYLD